MVQLVNPIVDLSRSIGGPQPGLAPIGEGSQEPSLLSMVSGGSDDSPLLGGGGGSFADTLAGPPPFVPGQPDPRSSGGGGGFLDSPLIQAGLSGIMGGNPLATFRAGLQAQAAQQQQAFENQLKVRIAQRKEAEFRAGQQQLARQQQALVDLKGDINRPDNGLNDNQKMAANFAIDAGDVAAVNGLLESLANKETFKPVLDADGNIIAQESEQTGKRFDDPEAAARDRKLQRDLTRRGQDTAAATARRGQDLQAERTPFVRVEMPDGTSFSAQRDDPRVKAAAEQGANVFTQSVQATSPDDLFQSKTVRGQIEGKKLDAINALARVNQIEAGFDPSFLEFGAAIDFKALRLKEKAGGELSPEQTDFVNRFSTFKRDAIGNINATLNELSGAAVSPQEEKRLRGQLPDPGQGIFDGDSPTQFTAKMRGLSKDLRRAIVRFNFATRRGENPLDTGIELADVDALIDRRGAEIKKELKAQNPDLDDSALRQAVLDQLQREFGL